jgi:type I restriction enzyme R subunit
VEAAFRDGVVQPTGTAITKILPPVSRFGPAGGHAAKKQTVLGKLGAFFDRFFGLS